MPTNHNIPVDGGDWMRDKERRMAHQEARPVIRDASDLMGPGLAAYAIQVSDWSSDEAAFNGILYSQPGALNTPDDTKWWIGTVLATADGNGIQTVRQFLGAAQPTPEYIREFFPGGSGHIYGPWALT